MRATSSYIRTSIVKSFEKRQRGIVVVGPQGTLSERFKMGVLRDSPWVKFIEVNNIGYVCQLFSETISLILLHRDALETAELSASKFSRFHPLALVGLLQDPADAPLSRDKISASVVLGGIIPLGLTTRDVVAIISFMLRGGEYFPRDRSLPEHVPMRPKVEIELSSETDLLTAQLTRRELQILELVSRGLQNKSIAAQLSLSEFTVKIHLHNIITKLGAHNRTEAADYFRKSARPTMMVDAIH